MKFPWNSHEIGLFFNEFVPKTPQNMTFFHAVQEEINYHIEED